ncbi:MAG: hypothetical protein Q9184_001011 [Pyrenodesmia sp. 2 TL-2023]
MAAKEGEKELSAAERVSQLNEVDKNVVKLLQHAGIAIKTLTVSTLEAGGHEDDEGQDMEKRKGDFAAASSQYFATLSSIDAQLRRHITALEDAGVLPSEAVIQGTQPAPTQAQAASYSSKEPPAKPKSTITNGGLGHIDIGWLNSRNDNVEKIMEAELWEQAQILLQKTLKSRSTSGDDDGDTMNIDRPTVPG